MLFPDNKYADKYWALPGETVADIHSADAIKGLTKEEAASRLRRYGPNNIISAKSRQPLLILLRQFTSPFILLLGISTLLSFIFQEWLDGSAILAVMILNAAIGFGMEYQAHRSMEALKKMTIVPARVIRSGEMMEIKSELLVPGDLLFIESGEMVTADARIIRASQLQTNESSLTGESFPVDKTLLPLQEDTLLAERSNMLYRGTFITKGNCRAVVVNTGMATELGKLAGMVQQANPATTPLEKKVQYLSKKLIWITLGLILIIFTGSLFYGAPVITVVKIAIALSVAAIPEGLPVVTTLGLSFGMLRMARHNVIVKKLSAVETLGGTNVICTDKTGTLTQNSIEVSLIQTGELAAHVQINPAGTSICWQQNNNIANTSAYRHLSHISALCNTASYEPAGNKSVASGDPLEIGLLKMIYAFGINPATYRQQFSKVDEIPFSSETRLMATLHKNNGDQSYYIAAKGAVEDILRYCTYMMDEDGKSNLSEAQKEQWKAIATKHAQSGFRILAFAFRESSGQESSFLHSLTLTGLIGFSDPPRPGVTDAIKECKKAGIRVIMITGDHPATAKNIALQLGIASPGDDVMLGSDMKPYGQLTAADRAQWLKTSVFARVSPEQKQHLVTVLQDEKLIVAMTGDGVNDAPALKKADIGIAMGLRGTQVAREAADMILKNDAFTSIVSAVKQGRIIFENIRKFVIFLLSCNLSELLVIAICALFNFPFQLFPLQILFINLLTDTIPALALGISNSSKHIMQRKPYRQDTVIIDKKRWTAIFVYALIITSATLGAAAASHLLFHPGDKWESMGYNNILFYTLIFSQLFQVLNMTFKKEIAFHKTEVFRNKTVWYAMAGCSLLSLAPYWIFPLKKALGIIDYNWEDWCIIMVCSLLTVIIIRIFKKSGWII